MCTYLNMWLKFVIIFGAIYSCCGTEYDFIQTIKDGIGRIKNPNCVKQFGIFAEAITNFDDWAWTMLDATGKLPSGILGGNIHELGNFDGCLDVFNVTGVDKIEGKYCLGNINISSSIYGRSWNMSKKLLSSSRSAAGSSISPSWGLCLPNACTADDLNEIFQGIFVFSEPFCQTKSTGPSLTTGDYVAIGLIVVLLLVLILSTSYDLYLIHSGNKTQWDILLAFSVVTNLRKLFHVSDKPNDTQITCLAGMRSISMMWVILCHGYAMGLLFPITNSFDSLKWLMAEENMFILGATVSVDTFFLMSGLVLVYVYMSKKEMRIIDIPYFYLHRYLRLTPVLAVVIGLQVTLVKFVSDGPYFPMAYLNNFCENGWWATLLYIQNYANEYAGCMGPSWYLAVDTQLYFLSPLLLIPLRKFTKTTLSAITILTLTTIGASFYVSWHYSLNGVAGLLSEEPTYMTKYYIVTHTRAGPWLIGLIFGYITYLQKKKKIIKMKIPIIMSLWLGSLTVLCVCVFCGHDLITDNSQFINSTYMSLVRPSWAIAVGWVIFACANGYGGPINKILSLSVFQVLGRLSYTMYIVHYLLLTVIRASLRSPQRFSNAINMHTFWGDFMTTFAVSVVLTLCFESPIIIIEKCLTKRNKPVQQDKSIGNDNEAYTNYGIENGNYTIPRVRPQNAYSNIYEK